MIDFCNLLKERGLSEKDVSDTIGVSLETVRSWKLHKSNPSAEKLVHLSRLLECSPEQLNPDEKITPMRMLRIDAGLSVDEVAAKLGVNRATINAWEIGRYPPSGDFLYRLSLLYGCPTSKLEVSRQRPNSITIEERNSYFEEHQNIIHWVLNQYQPLIYACGIEKDDAFQELAFWMLRAIELHDPSKGSTMKTYIITSLKFVIKRYAGELMAHGISGLYGVPWTERPKVCSLDGLVAPGNRRFAS